MKKLLSFGLVLAMLVGLFLPVSAVSSEGRGEILLKEAPQDFASAQRAERILDAMNRLLYGDAVAFACRTDYAPFGSIAFRGHFGGEGACLFVDVLAEKPFSFLRAEQGREPVEGTTEFRVGLQEGDLLILQVDPDGTLAVTWELTDLWLVTAAGAADAAALSATLRNASSASTSVPLPEGDLPVQAAMPEGTAPEAEALLEKWNEAVYGGAVDCLYLSDPLLVDRAEYVNDLIAALQRPGVVFDRYVESAPSDFKALGTYGLGWSKGGEEQRLTVTVSEEGRVFVSAEGFSGGLYTEECVSVDLIRWTTALWTKVSEEASYPGKGTPRPSVLPVPECKDEEAAQKAQALLDGWEMAIWDAKISYVTFIGRHNKSPVQIGDLIRYLRDRNITFTRYRDAEEVDWETVPVWGEYTLKVEGLAEEKLLLTVYPDGSLALGDAEWGYLRAEAGSVDPQMLSDLLPDVDYSNKEDGDTFNLKAACSMRSKFWSLLKSPAKNAADSEDFSKEQVSAFLTYLAAQGVTFIRAEREGVAEKGRVMHLGEYYRLALCEDGSLLFWKEVNDPYLYNEIDAANLALRLSPDSVDRGVVDILLYSDYVRIYNENRLLKLGGLL
jgi:hypothetical protein